MPVIRQPFKARTPEELVALLGTVATAILAVIIVTTIYFGRDIFIPIAMAILLSFVLAPLVLRSSSAADRAHLSERETQRSPGLRFGATKGFLWKHISSFSPFRILASKYQTAR